MKEKTLTLEQLVKYLGIKRRTLYNMIKDKRFTVACIQGTKPRRWNIEDIEKWRFSTRLKEND